MGVRVLPICYCDVGGYKALNIGRTIVWYTGRHTIKALPLLKKLNVKKRLMAV